MCELERSNINIPLKYIFDYTTLGAILLDHEGKDMTNVMSSIVDELVNIGYINEDTGDELLRVLLYRHKYVDSKLSKWSTTVTRNHSLISMTVRYFFIISMTKKDSCVLTY